MRNLDDLFAALGRSRFRCGFRLNAKDGASLRQLGLDVASDHAARFVRERLSPAQPANDGRQTPWRGHPVFVAQHATATCCRSCLSKWHGIEQGQPLTPRHVDYILQVIRRWLASQMGKHDAERIGRRRSVRAILHVDMDAFYASVEERENPGLVGKPLIVGGTPEGRGVVAAANYVVRQFGVHSAMPTARAVRLCPNAIVLPPRMDLYAEVSQQIQSILHRFTPLVEPLSLDEAFLDVTGSHSLFGSAAEIGCQIKAGILSDLNLIASVGVAPNKFLAKLASDLEKPDGLVVVDPDGIQEFLDPLPVSRLWGVGRVAGEKLARLGIQTIAEMRGLPLERLQQEFGEHGRRLWELSRGIDERTVVPDRQAKSISHETTFSHDMDEIESLRAWAVELSEQVARRLRRSRLRGRNVQLKIRFSDFGTITRSQTLSRPTNVTQEIWQAVEAMLSTRLPAGHLSVRLLGVGVSGFDQAAETQLVLFREQDDEAQAQVDEAADQIREKFGAGSIGRASGLLQGVKHTPRPRPDDRPTKH